jgi:hypothetical protein
MFHVKLDDPQRPIRLRVIGFSEPFIGFLSAFQVFLRRLISTLKTGFHGL